MSKKIEYRAFKTELRTMADKPCVEGYAAVYNVSTDLGYRESINPAAFVRALAEKQDVRGLFNHETLLYLAFECPGFSTRRWTVLSSPSLLSRPLE